VDTSIAKNLVTLGETKKMRIFVLIVLMSVSLAGFGQYQAFIDSLKTKLKTAPTDKQFTLLNSIGWEYRFAYPDSTIYYANKAYDLGKLLKLKKDLAKPLNFIGVAYNYKGDRLKSYEYYQEAITIAESQLDSNQLAYTNNNIGRLLFEQGVLPKSFNYFVNALKIFKATHDSSGIAYANQSLANLYRLQHDYQKAEETHLKALDIRLKLENSRDIMSAYAQLGILSQETNQLDISNQYFLKADSIGNVIHDDINLAEIKILLAENYLKQGQTATAEKIGNQGFKIIKQHENARMLPRAYLLMGKVHLANKDYLRARSEFSEALQVSKMTKSSAFQMASYYQLAQVANLMGKKQDEIGHMNQYLVLKDSVEDLDLARQVERLQFELQIESKDKENELLKLKQASTEAIVERQRLINILGGVVIAFLSVLAIISWQVNKRRRLINEKLAFQNQQINKKQQEIDAQNETLSKRNQLLSDANHEKDTLMSIVAHDLKSPLNRIVGLAALIELEGKLTSQQHEYLQLMKDVTKSGTNLITDLLDVNAIEENTNAPSSLNFDLTTLLKDRIDYFQAIAITKGIKLESVLPSSAPFASDTTYINRIVENLLSNAIKFSKSGTAVIVSGRCEKDRAYISVKDHGPGFTQADRSSLFKKFRRLSARPTASESSNGLGLAIVKTLVDRLGGTIELISESGKGSEFIVILPLRNKNTEASSSTKLAMYSPQVNG
jgi:signal transduction histidine kinase/Tfp pilus assembly protein PilF